MNPNLLQLIERWRERHPEAWPDGLQYDAAWIVDYQGRRRNRIIADEEAFALIEVAVMDALDRAGITREFDGDEVTCGEGCDGEEIHAEQNGDIDRLHALLLAVEEMEAK